MDRNLDPGFSAALDRDFFAFTGRDRNCMGLKRDQDFGVLVYEHLLHARQTAKLAMGIF